MCRLAVALALYGAYDIPPGDVGVIAFVSVKMAEARERLATIAQILDVLAEPYSVSGDEIRLHRRPIAFRVYPASFRTSVGFTGLALFADEVARWRDDDTGANPAHHVFSSMRPSLATIPNAIEVVVSSPWATLDYHYELCRDGTTDEQLFCEAPSWVANPVTMSEERARQLEPDDRTREREYGGPGERPPTPMSGDATTWFDAMLIEAAPRGFTTTEPDDCIVAGADTGFTRNSCALSIRARKPGGMVLPLLARVWRPSAAESLQPTAVFREMAADLLRFNVRAVMADSHYQASAEEVFGPLGIARIDAPKLPEEAYVETRILFRERRLGLVDSVSVNGANDAAAAEQYRRDLKETKGQPTATGRVRILLPQRQDGSHADLVAADVLACYQQTGYVVPRGLPADYDAEYEAMVRRHEKASAWWGKGKRR